MATRKWPKPNCGSSRTQQQLQADQEKAELARSQAVLAGFTRDNPTLAADGLAMVAMERGVFRRFVEDLSAVGFDVSTLKSNNDIAQMHLKMRANGHNVRSLRAIFADAQRELSGRNGATAPAPPPAPAVRSAQPPRPAPPRVQVTADREARRAAIPAQPPRSSAPMRNPAPPAAPERSTQEVRSAAAKMIAVRRKLEAWRFDGLGTRHTDILQMEHERLVRICADRH